MRGRVLIIAGSDSGGGAGLQADIKTVTALGGFAMTAITAITAQNSHGSKGLHEIPADFVALQAKTVLEDLGADCIKTGMLKNKAIVEAVAAVLSENAPNIPLVLDPVMVCKPGVKVLDDDAIDAVRTLLLPKATLLTPNIKEAEVLTGKVIKDSDDMSHAAEELFKLGAKNILLKGGHLSADQVTDILYTKTGVHTITHKRIDTHCVHGAGCSTASACAAGIAQNMPLLHVCQRALEFVHRAIATAPHYGTGVKGAINHVHAIPEYKWQELA